MDKEKQKRIIKLAITVGIGVLFVWFVAISPYISFQSNENKMLSAAKRYFELNEDKLPTGERLKTLTLKELYNGGYMAEDIYIPYSKEPCSINESWVKVKKQDGEYKYHVYLQCGVLKSSTDHKGPNIVLEGEDEITVNNGEKYEELGVKKVSDNTDGKMNVKDVKIDSSKVDTSKNGTYKVTYTISDSFNNKTVKERTVNVIQTIGYVTKKNSTKGVYKGRQTNNYVLLSGVKYRIVGLDGENVKLVTANDISNIDYNSIDEWLDYYYDNITDAAKKYIVKNDYCGGTLSKDKIDSNTSCDDKVKNKYVYLLSVKDMNESKDENGLSYLYPTTISWLANENDKDYAFTARDYFNGTDSKFFIYDKDYLFGIRPAITIKGDSLIKTGTGTIDNPYSFKETKKGKEDEYLNTRYPGEYISYSNREFRIIGIESDGTVKVIMNDTILSGIKYDTKEETKIYNPKQKGNVGYIINQKASSQINDDYFVTKEIKVPIYKNFANYNKEEESKTYKVKFSAPNTYDLFSATEKTRTYWLLNSSKTKNRKYIVSDIGVVYYNDVDDNHTSNARIVGYLNSKCKILSGSGTKENPYKIVK